MANLQRFLPSAPSQLLSQILDRPELVAAVRELPAATLSRLIDRIGLEDSGELIALASTEQLEAMFDEDLWREDGSAVEERFDPQRFALWLQVMTEAGSEFLVRRLCELPLDLLTLAVNRLVLVIDMDAMLNYFAGARDEAGQIERALESCTCEEWEEFCLVARDADAWEDVWNALLSLDRDNHERLRAILERCCAMSTEFINGEGGLYEVLTSDEMLESDALGERDDRRAAHGYVSVADARSFLALAREGAQAVAERDPITAAYFRAIDTTGRTTGRVAQAAAGARRLPASAGGADVEGLLQLIAACDPDTVVRRTAGARFLQSSAPAEPSTTNQPRVANRADAEKAVQRAGAQGRRDGSRPGAARAGRSSGHKRTNRRANKTERAAARAGKSGRTTPVERVPPPSTAEMAHIAPTKSPLAAALAALSSEHPTAHSARMEELVYLANVLIAGCKHEGRKLRPVEALEAAIATCNLGLELWERCERSNTVESDARLVQQVGCDLLFRTGWQALQRELVQRASRTLAQRCANLDADSAHKAQKLIREGDVFSLNEVCEASELDLDEASFDALLAAAEALPWQSRTDAAGAGPWIATRADFDHARRRLAELASSTQVS